MKKIVYIAPHLSTGGLPQYLFKQIESIKDDMDVYCIEWENVTGGVLVIQRNRIQNILGDKLITLPENKHELIRILKDIGPDVVHLQEIPEFFMPEDIADQLYALDRPYSIIETSHDSSFNTRKKIYVPDKFLMVSQYQIKDYQTLGIPCALVEYPIENKARTKTREQALRDLGLDPALKHVINVGLFTPRKNQAEIIEYAKMLKDYPIQFHFLGNHADNFKFYWEPLMKDFPSNCKWWNERNDVDAFYEAADLFLFTSRGNNNDKETMPLVIREALSWKTPSLIYNLPVYLNYFNKFDTIEYLQNNQEKNKELILNKLGFLSDKKECIVLTTYPNSSRLIEMTKNTILTLKKYNLPIILCSNCEVPDELKELADYFVLGENNILDHNGTTVSQYWFDSPNLAIQMTLSKDNIRPYSGPAAHTVIYDGISLAKKLGFDTAHTFSFDMKIYDSWFNKARKELQTKNMVIHRTNYVQEREYDVIRAECFSVNTNFFIENFPKISTIEDYYDWMGRLRSESNTLEKLWYMQVEPKQDEVYFIDDDELYNIINREDERGKHRSGFIFEVLPIKNNSSDVLLVFDSPNVPDPSNESVRIFINDKLHTEFSDIRRQEQLPSSVIQKVRCELYDVKRNIVISQRERTIDIKHFEQPHIKDSTVQFKNIIASEDTHMIRSRWDLHEQKMYYSVGRPITTPTIISVKEYKSNTVIWSFVIDNIQANIEYWVVPTPKSFIDLAATPTFTGVTLCMYDKQTGKQFYEQPFFHKFADIVHLDVSNDSPHYYNYLEFFAERKYDKWLNKKYDLVVDAGANVGLFTECMLKLYNANKVVAIECNQDLVQLLGKTFKRNTDVVIVPKALHFKDEPIVFYQVDDNSGISTTIKSPELSYTKEVVVPTITVNELINTYGTIDLLKIDIEGAEYEVLLNADNSLFAHMNNLLIECHYISDDSRAYMDKIIHKLRSVGYIVDWMNLDKSESFNGPPMIYAQRTSI